MPGSWSHVPSAPSSGSVISSAGWGAVVAQAITDLQGSWLGPFTNATARDAAVSSPTDGMVCYLTTPGAFSVRIGGAWVNIIDNGGGFTDLGATYGSLRTLGLGGQQAAAGNHTHGGSASVYTQTFTASGTWTCPVSVGWVDCLLVGGGGGVNAYEGGGGGGAVKRQWLAVTGSTAYTVTIGAGGTSGGGTGGTSSFGALLSCAGGVGGTTAVGGASGSGVPGGYYSYLSGWYGDGGGGGAGGPGGPGILASTSATWGGAGGAGLHGYGFGGGGAGVTASGSSYSHGNGSGGAGAANTGEGATSSGSSFAGGSGYCLLTWLQ